MKLENQVVSLELAKKLKELGVKQESLYFYCGGHTYYHDNDEGEYEECPAKNDLVNEEYCESAGLTMEFAISAFTVAELGEMLPYEMCDEHQDLSYFLTCEKREDPDYWMVYYHGDRGVLGEIEEAKTEADARAKMLIYLLENNLINNPL